MLFFICLKLLKVHDKRWLKILLNFLNAYGLKNKIIAYVKDEGSNLNTLTNALKFVVKCETLGVEENF
jgi:hypothetical protein